GGVHGRPLMSGTRITEPVLWLCEGWCAGSDPPSRIRYAQPGAADHHLTKSPRSVPPGTGSAVHSKVSTAWSPRISLRIRSQPAWRMSGIRADGYLSRTDSGQ